MKDRLEILEKTIELYPHTDIDGKTIQEVIAHLQEIQESSKSDRFVFDINYYGHDGGFDIYIKQYRKETDQEYESRMENERSSELEKKERKKAAELAKGVAALEMYKLLSKKFGKVDDNP